MLGGRKVLEGASFDEVARPFTFTLTDVTDPDNPAVVGHATNDGGSFRFPSLGYTFHLEVPEPATDTSATADASGAAAGEGQTDAGGAEGEGSAAEEGRLDSGAPGGDAGGDAGGAVETGEGAAPADGGSVPGGPDAVDGTDAEGAAADGAGTASSGTAGPGTSGSETPDPAAQDPAVRDPAAQPADGGAGTGGAGDATPAEDVAPTEGVPDAGEGDGGAGGIAGALAASEAVADDAGALPYEASAGPANGSGAPDAPAAPDGASAADGPAAGDAADDSAAGDAADDQTGSADGSAGAATPAAATAAAEPRIVSDDVGVHRYLITEDVPTDDPDAVYDEASRTWSVDGVTYDAGSYLVTVDVSASYDPDTRQASMRAEITGIDRIDAQGAATPVTVAGDDGGDNAVFTNAFAPVAPAEVVLAGSKTLTGRPWTAADSFAFLVYDEGGDLVTIGTADEIVGGRPRGRCGRRGAHLVRAVRDRAPGHVCLPGRRTARGRDGGRRLLRPRGVRCRGRRLRRGGRPARRRGLLSRRGCRRVVRQLVSDGRRGRGHGRGDQDARRPRHGAGRVRLRRPRGGRRRVEDGVGGHERGRGGRPGGRRRVCAAQVHRGGGARLRGARRSPARCRAWRSTGRRSRCT